MGAGEGKKNLTTSRFIISDATIHIQNMKTENCKVLAEDLRTNTSLTDLTFHEDLGKEGMQSLLSVLVHRPFLQKLTICENDFFEKELLDLLEKFKFLEHLVFCNCRFPPGTESHLKEIYSTQNFDNLRIEFV